MRIVQINSVCGTGSTGRLVAQISDYLSSVAVENYIAYGVGKSTRDNAFCFGSRMDSHFHSFCSRKMGLQGKLSHVTTLRLLSYLNRIKPTIVHIHNLHGHYLNYSMLFDYFNKNDIKIVWTFHDCWPITGKCAHFTAIKCYKWKTGCYNCPQLSSYPDSVVDRSQKAYNEKKKYFAL